MNKEEKLLYSLSAIKNIFECFDIDVEIKIEKNDKEYIVNAYKEIEKCIVDYVNSLQPYKFDELKKGMWVCDDKVKWIYKIKKINGRNSIEVDNGDLTYTSLVFEEGRFFPVTKAMEYQE